MNIAEYSIKKQTIVYLFAAILFAGGIIGFINAGRLEDPDFTINIVKIITRYPGAEPSEVEEEVSDIIEQYVQKIPEVDYVESESSFGLSIVTVNYNEGYNSHEYRQMYDELRRKVNDARRVLPSGTSEPYVNDDFKDVYGILYAITGDGYTLEEIHSFAEYLQKELLIVDGVGKIDLISQPTEVVYLELSRTKITEMGISEDDIYSLLKYQNAITDSGTVTMGGERLQYIVSGNFDTVQSLGNSVIISAHGSNITLSDIADIHTGYLEPPQGIFRFNGERAIGIGISVITTENVVEVGKRITKRLLELKEETPIGLELSQVFNQPDTVKKAVNNFLISLMQAVIIVIWLLLVFMGLQSGLIIGVILLLIITGTLLLMFLFNITLQRVSLGALIIAMGMLVDNSIVVTEGILVRYQRGENRLNATVQVVKQTMWPLFGATVVAIFAFAAVGMSPNSAGEYTKTLFYVIIISLMLSWVLAITLNPLICYHFMYPKIQNDRTDFMRSRILTFYKSFLEKALAFKWVSLMITITVLIVSIWGFQFIDNAFFPSSTQPQFMIDYWMPEGTDITKTEQGMKKIEKFLSDKDRYPNITKISTFAGTPPLRFQLTFSGETQNGKYGMFLIEVDDNRVLDKLIPQIQKDLEDRFLEPIIQAIPFAIGPGGKGTISTRIYGPDPDILRELSVKIMSLYKSTDNAVAVKESWGERIKVISINVDEFQARQVGITRPQISIALKQGFDGRTVGIFRKGNKQMPIISIPPEYERQDVRNTMDLYVYSPVLKSSIPLTQLIKNTEIKWKDRVICRRDRSRMIAVQCDPLKGQPSVLFNNIRPAIDNIELPPGYKIEHGGEYESSTNAQRMVLGNLPLAILAMFLTIVILWNKFKQPIIIFLSIPLSIIGVVIGLLVTGSPFSFMAIMGLLSLFGMVIKNAIVLVDEFDLMMKEGKEPFNGIIESSAGRIRPVMMAAFSTILGMIPLITDSFFQSMAITIMFGLAVASLITLIVTPVLYAIFFKIEPAEENIISV